MKIYRSSKITLIPLNILSVKSYIPDERRLYMKNKSYKEDNNVYLNELKSYLLKNKKNDQISFRIS